MKIGVIKEIKSNENRVSLPPRLAERLVQGGHEIFIEQGAGAGSGFEDADYQNAGAETVATAKAWEQELILKVKEPLVEEYPFLKGQILFTYLHLAGVDISLIEALLLSKTTAIGYETVEDEAGKLPLLAPMSAVAGSMAVSMGNYFLARFNQGRGNLLGNMINKRHGKVVIVGDGIVGQHAARVAAGLGTKDIVVMGLHESHEKQLHEIISQRIRYVLSSPETIAEEIIDADVVVGAVLVRGKTAPHVINETMVKSMPAGAVIIDVSIDQGGCVETSRPTTHADPVFSKHGIIHYCVTNMPGAYPRTSTVALTSATWPYIEKLAEHGLQACREDAGFLKGLNTYDGYLANADVADAMNMMEQYRAAF